MQASTERREYLRANVNVFVNEDLASGIKLARVLDISEGGMRYTKPAGPVERTCPQVYLEFCLPDDEEPVKALGRVVVDELDEVHHATSISFTALDSRDAERIRQYVIRRKRAELFEMLHREHVGTATVAS